MTEYTADQKLAAVEREIRYRKRVYRRLVQFKQMTQELADEQIAIFEAIAVDYRLEAAKERLL